jgi:hypothetical protein
MILFENLAFASNMILCCFYNQYISSSSSLVINEETKTSTKYYANDERLNLLYANLGRNQKQNKHRIFNS